MSIPPHAAEATNSRKTAPSWLMKVGLVGLAIVGLMAAFTTQARAATVMTDQVIYAAGDVVFISGSGWTPGELVTLEVTESPAESPAHPADLLYAAASEDGIIDAEYILPGHGASQTFTLTATAQLTGATAQTAFTNSDDPEPFGWPFEPTMGPSVMTDMSDYVPGDIVFVSGSGWEPGELVILNISEEPLDFHPVEALHAVADEYGNIYAGYVIQAHDLGQTFLLTATGQTSGRTAETTFTDGPKVGSVGVGSQSPASITAGSTATYTIIVNRGSGSGSSGAFSATLATSSLPAGATASFSPSTVAFTPSENSKTSILTISTTCSTPGGTTNFTAKATRTDNVSDNATSAPASLNVTANPCDSEPPVVNISFPASDGQNGWFKTSPVIGAVTASDPAKVAVINCTGATLSNVTGYGTTNASGVLTVTGEGVHTVSCIATDSASPSHSGAAAGSNNTATLKTDTTPPQLNRTPPDQTAWYSTDVNVPCTATDALSNLASAADASFSLSTNVAAGTETESAMTDSRQVCDATGNCATAGPIGPFKIDKRAPDLSANGGSYSAGTWTNQDVTVSFICTDGGSGVASVTGATVVSAEGANQSVSGTCTDHVGNSANTAFQGINIDKTAPVVTATPDRGPDSNGWYNHAVTITFSGDDTLSGIASCTSSVYDGPDSDSAAVNGSCTDNAGNTGVGTFSLQYDATQPLLNPSVSPNPILLNGSATASAGATDNLSGIAYQGCGALVTSSVGSKQVTCSATDQAGNATSQVISYNVQYANGGSCLGAPSHAILQPINADNSSVFKWKSTVPAKFRVCDANGVSIGTPGVVDSFRLVQKISGTTVADVDEAVVSTTPDTAFRWSSTDQQWIFNMNSKNLSANYTYVYRITLNDLTTIDFQFGLK